MTRLKIWKNAHTSQLRRILTIGLFFYIVLQPLLDTYYLFTDEVVALFGVSPATLLRFGGILLLGALTFFLFGRTKKAYFFFGYLALVLLYFIFHCVNAGSFETLHEGIRDYSLINEAVYVFRMTIPAFVLYIMSELTVCKQFIQTAVISLSATISGLIVSTNLLGISLESYTNETIKSNIFTWFTYAYQNNGFFGLSSKAFFNFANTTSVVLCLLLPTVLYYAFSKRSVWLHLLGALQGVAMMMIGTKAAAYGALLIYGAVLAAYLFFWLREMILQKRFSFKRELIHLIGVAVVIVLLAGVLLPKSPAVYRSGIANNRLENYDTNKQNQAASGTAQGTAPTTTTPVTPTTPVTSTTPSNPDSDNTPVDSVPVTNTPNTDTPEQLALKKKLDDSGIIAKFYEKSYPYTGDTEFWTEFVALPSYLRLDSRYLEEAMFIRIKEINDNPWDHWFGITYSRTSRVFNLERDILYQFYSLGIFGLLLFILPYFVILVFGIFRCLRNFKAVCDLRNVCFLFSIALTLALGYFCGNTLDSLFATVLLAFICGGTLQFLRKSERSEEGEIQQ